MLLSFKRLASYNGTTENEVQAVPNGEDAQLLVVALLAAHPARPLPVVSLLLGWRGSLPLQLDAVQAVLPALAPHHAAIMAAGGEVRSHGGCSWTGWPSLCETPPWLAPNAPHRSLCSKWYSLNGRSLCFS